LGSELHIGRGGRAALLGLVCAALWAPAGARAGSAEAQLRDASAAPLPDAVVSLRRADGSPPPASPPPAPAAMDQRDRQFAPHVLAVQRDAAVDFPNSDQIRHHVYSFSEAKRFELRLYSGVPAEPVVFERAGTVVLGCNIHDDMIGFVRVVDTPWYAKSDAQGMARIEGVPAGRYLAEVWHPRLPDSAPVERELEIREDAPARLELSLELGPEPAPDRPRRLLRDRLR
jgi:plastocyanin